MAKQLIITADDFGAMPFINEGIFEAIQNDKLTSVSTFVTHQTSRSDIEDLKILHTQKNQSFGIGLHLSLTSGFSQLFRKSTLTKDSSGQFHYFKDAKRYRFNQVDLNDLEEEMIAQLNKLDDYLGDDILIDHVSCHFGVTYIDLAFFHRYASVIANYNYRGKYNRPIPMRSPMSWLKSHNNGIVDVISTPTILMGLHQGMQKKYFELTKSKLLQREQKAKQLNIRYPGYLVDIIYGQPSVDILNEVVSCFQNGDFSTEFMCHLGMGNSNPANVSHGINPVYFPYRSQELQALLNWDLAGAMSRYGFTITDYQGLS